MHKFLVCACKSQDFAQSQKIFARSHDRETVTFRNSAGRHFPFLIQDTVLYSSLLYYTVLYSSLLYYTVLYSPLLCYTVFYSTLLHYTVLYHLYTVQQCSVLHWQSHITTWIQFLVKIQTVKGSKHCTLTPQSRSKTFLDSSRNFMFYELV